MGQEEVGYQRISAQEVKTYSEKIGHTLDEDEDIDQLNIGGWPGIADATHAEKQAAIGSLNQPIGVSYLMCDSCQDFFSKHAMYTGRIQYVADPKVARIFYSDGTGSVISHSGEVTTWMNSYVA